MDEPESWPRAGDLLLNRFRYGGFVGGPVDARTRLDWLSRQAPERGGARISGLSHTNSLSNVLDQMGHRDDARKILFEKERLQRRMRRTRANRPRRAILLLKDALLLADSRLRTAPAPGVHLDCDLVAGRGRATGCRPSRGSATAELSSFPALAGVGFVRDTGRPGGLSAVSAISAVRVWLSETSRRSRAFLSNRKYGRFPDLISGCIRSRPYFLGLRPDSAPIGRRIRAPRLGMRPNALNMRRKSRGLLLGCWLLLASLGS